MRRPSSPPLEVADPRQAVEEAVRVLNARLEAANEAGLRVELRLDRALTVFGRPRPAIEIAEIAAWGADWE